MKSVASLVCAALFVTPTAVFALDDCVHTDSLYGKTGKITVQNGVPVKYQWGDFTSDIEVSGDTYIITAATISNVVTGKTQSGKSAIQGQWEYKNRSTDVTFVCR